MSSAAIAFINTKRWTLKIKQCTNMNASNNIHGTHISLTIR
jgi:hypothetical protein